MPFMHVFDNSIGAGAQLAANAGQYDAGQTQFHNQLAANQDARAQQSADQASQDSADRLDFQYANMNAQNKRYQSGIDNKYAIQELGADEKYTLQDLKSKEAAGLIDARSKSQLPYLDAKDKFLAGQNEANRNVKEGEFWDGTLPEKYDATDAANTRNQNTIDAANRRIAAQKDMFDKKMSLMQAKQLAQASNDPNAYRAVAAHAADLIHAANAHRQAVARQLASITAAMANLPNVNRGPAAQDRARYASMIEGLKRDMPVAEQAYQDAITEANAARMNATRGGRGVADQNNAGAPGDPGQAGDPYAGGIGGQQQPAPVQIQSDQDFDMLPSGTMFVPPDGSIRQKP